MSGAAPSLTIDCARVFIPLRFEDDRGWTGEIVSPRMAVDLGTSFNAVQENQSFSRYAGVIRGLHFQRPPYSQAKIVRVARGAVMSVVLDLRVGRQSSGQCDAVRQTFTGGECLYVPAGCAHGVAVLEDQTVLCWTNDAPFDGDSADGVLFSDPALAIDWPFPPSSQRTSARDLNLPTLAMQPFRFDHTGRHAAGR